MSEKNSQMVKSVQIQSNETELRILPFFFAVLICFIIAILLGSGSWYFFGSNNRAKIQETTETDLPANIIPATENSPKVEIVSNATSTPTTSQSETIVKTELKNLVVVGGGEIAIGGGETKQPLKRVFVDGFSISETEVTNSQYADFIKETNHPSPPGWKKDKFPKDTDNYPVSNVSYRDAEAFCQWLKNKSGLPVRLPTEAEWELAARGTEGKKYPWGSDWDKKGGISNETGGKVSPVKSFPLNRSPFGAYDMVGNVWEWTQEKVGKNDVVSDESVKKALEKGQVLRIIKGGSAEEKAAEIFAQARYEIPEKTKVPFVGFRYIVEKQ